MSKAKIKPKKYATKILARARECIPTEKKGAKCSKIHVFCPSFRNFFEKVLVVSCNIHACASCFEGNYDRAPPQEIFIALFHEKQNKF